MMSGQSKSLISIVVVLENWVQHRFQKFPFSSVHTTTKRFRKSPLSKAFSKVPFSVETTLPTHRLHVDGRLKRMKKDAFSYENPY